MVNVSNNSTLVWKYLDQNLDIRRNLSRGIVNIRSLAKYILEEHPELNLGITGVISALRRYSDDILPNLPQNLVSRIIAGTKLSMGFGNCVVHIIKSEHSLAALTELFKKLNLLGENNVHLLMDKNSFVLIFDNEHYEMVRSQFPDRLLMSEKKNVGRVSIKFSQAATKVPNIYAKFVSELGTNGINIHGAITKNDGASIFIGNDDVMPACNLFNKMINHAKKASPQMILETAQDISK